ncbi:Ribosomal protein S18 [Forsythia ovata]|uniref:Small ribosomal subunit protein bS18c n=1 Tax=Forsythia ovata TaxID=205694 RepID=A0ABD1W577_9LAMI
MKLIRNVLWSVNFGLSRQFQRPQVVRTFSASPFSGTDDKPNSNSFESSEEFEQRIFGDASRTGPSFSSFYQKLDKAEKAHDQFGLGSKFNIGNRANFLDGLDESFNTLSDGMDEKLKKAATYFEYDPEEIGKDDYAFRPDMNFWTGNTYDTKDLDLRKPGIRKPYKRNEFETTSEEVLRKADFRNVRFLANFITEAGIIIKRSKTRISAKAQRKVAREIKTARAFGLMPFTTMGTKQFIYGKTMEGLDEDYSYETYDRNFVEDETIYDLRVVIDVRKTSQVTVLSCYKGCFFS